MRWQARFNQILMVDVVTDTRTNAHLVGPDGRVIRFANAEAAEDEAKRQNRMER